MKDSLFTLDVNEEEDSFFLKETIYKYLRYWPWFLVGVVICIGIAYAYLRQRPQTYASIAKIKIVDDAKESNIASDALALLANKPGINLENEIEVLKSARLLRQVVSELNLDVETYWQGNVKTTMIWETPFTIAKTIKEDSLKEAKAYNINLNPSFFAIEDESGNEYSVAYKKADSIVTGLPFKIQLVEGSDVKEYSDINFLVVLVPGKEAVQKLAEALVVEPTDQNSEILSVAMEGQSVKRSEDILNTLIGKYDRDGILDRQLVSRRTLEVIDKRFVYLSGELDSIELGKQAFKQANALSFIEADAGLTMQRKSETEDEVITLENQIALSSLLKETVVNQAEYSLLPADIGLENTSLNSLVTDYNQMALERAKMLPSVGINHPNLQSITGQMERAKVNLIRSVNIYQSQLNTSLAQLNREKERTGAQFTSLPAKEKTLRAIERQQSIKENLFLILLQKREEAAINLAATAPSVKVIDYALTSSEPVGPKKILVYPLSLALGMLVPFVLLYIRFSLDTRISGRDDLEQVCPDVPILAEIPFFKGNKSFIGFNDRSVLAESFRILATNSNHLLARKNTEACKVIYITSSIKGEGKTLMALNLSLSYASLKKRVLLLGADLRNPQLDGYFSFPQRSPGLADYLGNPGMDWEECILDGVGNNRYHKVCISGPIPLNAPELLSDKGFEKFMNQAKAVFDYIIVDTAPVLLVTDTLLISDWADLTLFVTRVGFTEKRLLKFAKELDETGKLKSMALVLNEAGFGKSKDYNYGYGYGYTSEND
jgi:capsular exopolysaccharide synthesis family protein